MGEGVEGVFKPRFSLHLKENKGSSDMKDDLHSTPKESIHFVILQVLKRNDHLKFISGPLPSDPLKFISAPLPSEYSTNLNVYTLFSN